MIIMLPVVPNGASAKINLVFPPLFKKESINYILQPIHVSCLSVYQMNLLQSQES